MSGGVCSDCDEAHVQRLLLGRCGVGGAVKQGKGGNRCVCIVCLCDTAGPKGLITFELAVGGCCIPFKHFQCNHVLVAVGSRRPCRLSIGQHLYIDLRSRQPCVISHLPDSSFAPTPTLVKQGFMSAQR
jgi:hypothetical protein